MGRGYGYFRRGVGVGGDFGVNGSLGVGFIRTGEYKDLEREGARPNILRRCS